MKKINKWKSKGYTKKEMEELVCKNGSFTCGLHTKLKTGTKCNACRKEDELKEIKKQLKEDSYMYSLENDIITYRKQIKKGTPIISEGMNALYDYCNDIKNPSAVTKKKMREFITEKEFKWIVEQLGEIRATLAVPRKWRPQKYPSIDIIHIIKPGKLWD